MLATGTPLGPYRILSPLGAGGMGEVYRARDTRLARDVALKVVRAEHARDPDRSRRFELEARAAGAVNHPNVCTIFDVGTYDGAPFVVMELLEGESLRERLRAGPLPLRKALDYATQAARGLSAAHEKGIVHRDLKPENLFVTRDGRVKVLDFGLAKLTRPDVLTDAGDPTLSLAATESGAVLGTAGYMAPEQVRGQDVDARTDIFALGAIVHEMVSGKRTFSGATFLETASAILTADPEPLSAASGEAIPAEFESIVTRCLEKNPAQRFQSAGDLAFGLETLTSGQGRDLHALRPMPAPHATARPGRRVRTALLAAAVLVLVAGAVLVALGPGRGLWQRGPTRPAQPFWLVLSEFDGPPDDPILTAAVQDLVRAAIDASGVVAVLPRDRIRFALQRAGKPDTAQVRGVLAREIAVRSGVRAVLEGSLRRAGAGYAVVLRVSNPDSGQTVVTVTGTAADADALIPSAQRLATRLLNGMRRRQTEIAAYRFNSRPPATPSFEAYRRYTEAGRAWGRFDYPTARQRYHMALALDPGYAAAWASLGILSGNEGMPDSARTSFEEALRHRERSTPEEQLSWEAHLAQATGDTPAAVDALGRLIAMGGPGVRGAFINRGVMLNGFGMLERSLADFDSAAARTPKGMNQLLMNNRCEVLLQLGRLDEAREALEPMTGRWRKLIEPWFPIYAGQWALAESAAVASLEDPAMGSEEDHARSLSVIAAQQAARGEVTSAFQSLGLHPYPDLRLWDEMWLSRASGRPFELPPGLLRDSSHVDTLTRALALAWKHDPVGAERLLRRRAPRKHPLPEPYLLLARGLIAENRQRWGEVVDLLSPLARKNDVLGNDGLIQLRWTVAGAFEQMGKLDSAAVYLESALRPDRQYKWERIHIRMTSSFAHQRLVMLYARMGRSAEAEQHLAVLEHVFTDPDPDMRRLLEEARVAAKAVRMTGRPVASRS